EVIITTDEGMLSLSLPDSVAFARRAEAAGPDYRIVLGYQDMQRRCISGDTLYISQENMKLHFDIVRPEGSGNLKYSYFLPGNKKWHSPEGKDLLLPALTPGSTTRMLLRFSDDVWIGEPVAL